MDTAAALAATTPGRRLRELRIARGLNQTQVAVQARVAIGTISQLERDERVPLDLTAERIARVFGVDRSDIWPELAA